MKKLLYLSDLYQFYVDQNKNIKFNSHDSDSAIVVHIEKQPLKFEKSEDDELVLKANLRFCHTDLNRNQSFISKKTMEEALPTVYNMPILGYIWDDNGTPKFASHEFYLDENGETVYEEIPVGVVPESSPLEFHDVDDKTYLEGTGIIWKTYSKASEILERESDLSVSIEILVDELSYSADDKTLVLDKIRFTGVTILQEDPETGKEVEPGMQGAKISIDSFSAKNNSMFGETEIKQFIKASIAEALDNINSKEGGQKMKFSEEKLNELLEKYAVKSEDLTFDLEGIESDEALEQAFEAQFSNPSADTETAPEPEPEVEEKTVTMSITYGETVRTFSRSLGDVIYALSDLVNATYSDDQTLYMVDVFDDGSAKSKYLIMQDMFSGKAYKQGWSFKDGAYALKGERTEVYSVWVTAEEREELESLRSNYSALTAKYDETSKELDLYKAEPDKVEMLNNDDYASIRSTAEFEELSKRENYFSLTKEELEGKLNVMLQNFAKQYGKEHANENVSEQAPVGVKRYGFAPTPVKTGRYGNTFSRTEE